VTVPIVPADAPPTSTVTLMRTTALSTYLSAIGSQAPGTPTCTKNAGGTTGGTKTIRDSLVPANPTYVLDRYTLGTGVLAAVEVTQAVYRTRVVTANADGQSYLAYTYRVFVALALSKPTPPGGSVVCYEWYADPVQNDPDPWDLAAGAFGCPFLLTWTRIPVVN
jgi:hypothetical protein